MTLSKSPGREEHAVPGLKFFISNNINPGGYQRDA